MIYLSEGKPLFIDTWLTLLEEHSYSRTHVANFSGRFVASNIKMFCLKLKVFPHGLMDDTVSKLYCVLHSSSNENWFALSEGADKVRGRGEKRGREGGEEGEGGGRRGGGRREKRGREEGEGRKKGREGERRIFCAREARAAPEGRRETRGREGEVRGREGGEAYPPVHPLLSANTVLATKLPTDSHSTSLHFWKLSDTVLHWHNFFPRCATRSRDVHT